jgi:hypothetical protein
MKARQSSSALRSWYSTLRRSVHALADFAVGATVDMIEQEDVRVASGKAWMAACIKACSCCAANWSSAAGLRRQLLARLAGVQALTANGLALVVAHQVAGDGKQKSRKVVDLLVGRQPRNRRKDSWVRSAATCALPVRVPRRPQGPSCAR